MLLKMCASVAQCGFLIMVLVLGFSIRAEAAPEQEDASSDPVETNNQTQQQNSDSGRIGGLDTEQLQQLILADETKPHEVVWLEVKYPEQESSVNVLALEQKPRSPLTQGAVLLLHDKEQHANWPFMIRSLRMSLPDFGWYTLSVNLPYDEVRTIPERTMAAKSSEEIILTDALKAALMKPPTRLKEDAKKSSEKSISPANAEEALPDGDANITEQAPNVKADPSSENIDIDLAEKKKNKKQTLSYRERANIHIQAAMDHLRGQGYQNIVVIGYRAGADLALAHIQPISQQITKQGFALVMIDPVLRYAYQNDIANALGEGFKAPVLDIVNGANLDNRVKAVERQTGARMANAEGYRQIRLIANENGTFQQSLLRRVRFWLEKYAPGISVTKVSTRR